MPSAPTSSAQLIDLVRKSGIVPPDKLASISDLTLPPEPKKAAAALVSQGVVTKFQATQLLAGRHKGFRIGAYTVLDMLGRGGMGAVYLAEHVALHRKVAIKVLVPGKDEDQKLAIVRFQREARSVAALDHPNIVRIFDVARHNDVPYLVMEFVEGQTLQALLDRSGAFPYATVIEYIAQAASGLQHAHEKGFVHRDIKPGNLMLDRTGTVKILDMGLARTVGAMDQVTAQLDNGAVVGTADFIAPEQAINNPSVDIRADIYSLGATFFSLVIGKPPFDGNTTQKLLQHQLRSAPSLISVDATLPRGLSDVVVKMLAKKPADRYQTPAEVIAALMPWMTPSAKILVGLSRTNLGSDESLATLSGINLAGSSLRLRAAETDSRDSNALESTKETGTLSSVDTTREPSVAIPGPVTTRNRRVPVVAAAVLALVATGSFGAWLASGHDKKDDAVAVNVTPDTKAPVEHTSTPPTSLPNATPTVKSDTIAPAISPNTNAERVLCQFDAAALQPFTQRLGWVADANDPAKKVAKVLLQSGGMPPAGWRPHCWNKDSEMDYFAEPVDGKLVLGIRNLRNPASAMLIAPSFACPTGLCRLTFDYQASTKPKKFVVKFKPSDARTAWEVATPQGTGDVWRHEDLLVDLKGAKGGSFEFHNSDGDASAAIRFRTVAITELKSTGKASADAPAVDASDPATWTEGKTVYALDIAAIPAFRVKKEKFTRTEGDAEMLPSGVGCLSWKDNALAEFRCEKVKDVPALLLSNHNDQPSAQFYFQLEGELQVPLAPGRAYRAKVQYLTRNDAHGAAVVQVTPGYKSLASVTLEDSGGKWSSAAVSFVRPPAEDRVEVRMVIDNSSSGDGNELWFRSVEIVELVPPK